MIFLIIIFSTFFVAPKYGEFKNLRQVLGEKKADYDAQFAYYS